MINYINIFIIPRNDADIAILKKQHDFFRDDDHNADDKFEDDNEISYDNDASLMLDYELGETSMQYFLDDRDDIDSSLGPSKTISGKWDNFFAKSNLIVMSCK